MPRPSQLRDAVDRRLARLVQSRARRRSTILRLLPDRWLAPLLAPTVDRLRTRLLTAMLTVSVLLLSAVFWLALK